MQQAQPVLVRNPVQLHARLRSLWDILATGDVAKLTALDLAIAIPQTEVWVAAEAPGTPSGWMVAPSKLAAYDVDVEDYPRWRRTLRGGDAARLVRRWGRELVRAVPSHPAVATIKSVAERLGTAPRREFAVFVLDVSGSDDAQVAHGQDASSSALAAIVALLPMLDASARARLKSMLAA